MQKYTTWHLVNAARAGGYTEGKVVMIAFVVQLPTDHGLKPGRWVGGEAALQRQCPETPGTIRVHVTRAGWLRVTLHH